MALSPKTLRRKLEGMEEYGADTVEFDLVEGEPCLLVSSTTDFSCWDIRLSDGAVSGPHTGRSVEDDDLLRRVLAMAREEVAARPATPASFTTRREVV